MSNQLLQYQVALFDASGVEITDFPRLSAWFHEVDGRLQNRDAFGWGDDADRALAQIGSAKVLNVYVSTDGLHTETVFEHAFLPKISIGPHGSLELQRGELVQN
jgi:hypothetical protein